MKIAKLLAGVAAIAMVAGAAQAGNVYQGSASGTLTGIPFIGSITGTVATGDSLFGFDYGTPLIHALDNANPGVDSNISLITITGQSGDNIGGSGDLSDGATFTLKGNVSTDCAYYSGDVDTTVDFGTIGIYTSDNTGPANAFDMTAPATVAIDTNLAGCNTRNTVTLSKNDIRGMVNNSGVGYDNNVFQANLPYSAEAIYTAGPVGVAGPGTSGNHVVLAENANSASNTHGAWKSAMKINVVVPVAAKSLVAGNYEGQLKVEIKAGI